MAGIERIVNTRFQATDKITKRFGIMERAAARFGLKTERSFRRASRAGSRFRDVTKGVIAGLTVTRGIGLITRGLFSITESFIAFDKAVLGATVRFKDIGPEAANFNEKLKEIRASARFAGKTTEFTAAQAGEALDFLARAGFTSAEAMGSLRSMIDLATASGEDFATVADQSSDLLGAFGFNVNDTAQKISNLNRLNDVLVKSANTANVRIDDMFETMKIAGPIAVTLGIELEEVAALTAIMGSAGIKGSQGATALKNSFLNLSTQKKAVVDMLRGIGVEIDDGTGDMRKFTDILADVGTNIADLGKLQQAKVLDVLFGKRAIAGASGLIKSIGDVREFETSLVSAGGASRKSADIMRGSIFAMLKTLQSAVTDFGFKILQAFEVDGKKGIESLTEAIRKLDPAPVVEFFQLVKRGLVFLFEWRNVIFTIGAGFLALKGFLIAAEVAMVLFNIATAANPIGLVVLAVAGLVAVLVDALTGFKLLQSAIDSVKGFFGFGAAPDLSERRTGPGEAQGGVSAPNQGEARAAAVRSVFSGRLDIAGAPPGSSVSSSSSGEDVFDIVMLGGT